MKKAQGQNLTQRIVQLAKQKIGPTEIAEILKKEGFNTNPQIVGATISNQRKRGVPIPKAPRKKQISRKREYGMGERQRLASRLGSKTTAVRKLIIQNPTEPPGQLAKMQLDNNFTATKHLIRQTRKEMVSEGLVFRIPKKPLSFTPEQQRIYTENLPEITRQLNRVARSLPSFLQEDFIAHSQEIIIRVIQNFDPDKGKLKIYVTRSLTENRKRFLSNLTRNISGIPHNRINSALKTDKLAQKKIAGGMRKDTAYREAAEEVIASTKSKPRNMTPEYILEDLRAINTARSQIPYHELQEEKAGSLPGGKKRTPRKLR